ncbi:V-type ATP synthase subunit E [bacterium BMS3Abin03]|nr:V-type ATP synthase subunit E [bacterium BMS3Abin03]
MALEDLLKTIRSKAEEEANRITQEAATQAKRILNDAKTAAEAEAKKFYDDSIDKCTREANQKISKAKLESRNKILNFKKEIGRQVFNESLKKLQNIDDKTYKHWLKKKILTACETGDEQIVFSEKDKDKLEVKWQQEINNSLKSKGLNGSLVFKFENTDFNGGFILKHPGYEIVVTFEDLLKEIEQKWLTKISEILFNNTG